MEKATQLKLNIMQGEFHIAKTEKERKEDIAKMEMESRKQMEALKAKKLQDEER